jgi:hypothetical protein
VSISLGYALETGVTKDKKTIMYREETYAVTKADINRIIAAQM